MFIANYADSNTLGMFGEKKYYPEKARKSQKYITSITETYNINGFQKPEIYNINGFQINYSKQCFHKCHALSSLDVLKRKTSRSKSVQQNKL